MQHCCPIGHLPKIRLALFNILLAAIAAPVWANDPQSPANIDRILFLGNSITLHPPLKERGWEGNWGMAASGPDKDYVSLLTRRINEFAGSKLALVRVDPSQKDANGSPNLSGANVVNIAEILERQYANYDSAKLRTQCDARPDLVVLQFGENVRMDAFDAAKFTAALKQLVGELQKSSNPMIFITGQIYGPNPKLDQIKQQIVAEDPARRVFVDLSGFRREPANNGFLDHPNDRGMKSIADTLFAAIRSACPERSTRAN
jgi:hypothetical protein